MASERYTPADANLCASLKTKYGINVEPRRLQDWRRLGLVEHEVRSRGRGKGREANYPPQAVEQARTVYALVAQLGTLSDTTLALFGVGWTPTEKAFRAAFANAVKRHRAAGERVLVASAEGLPSFSDRVRHGSASIAREIPGAGAALRSAVRDLADEHIEEEVATGLSAPSLGIAAKQAREALMTDALASVVDPEQSTGEEGRVFEALGGPDLADYVEEAGGAPSLTEMQETLDLMTYSEIVAARDSMRGDFLSETEGFNSPLIAFIRTNFDNPALVGVPLAFGIASDRALARRAAASASDSEGQHEVA